jgi:hypothetical protein
MQFLKGHSQRVKNMVKENMNKELQDGDPAGGRL